MSTNFGRKLSGAFDAALFLAVDLHACLSHPVAARFAYRHGGRRRPRIAMPQTVNEKFAWRKIFDHDPRFPVISDKLAVKAWARRVVPNLVVPRTLWSGTEPDQIPEEVFAHDVVVKANHGSAMNLVVRRGELDRAKLRSKAVRWLAADYAGYCGEWGYAQIPRRLFVEEHVGAPGTTLHELKFYTYGERILRMVQIVGRFGEMAGRRYACDADGMRLVDTGQRADVSDKLWEGGLPATFDVAEDVARRLGAQFDQMRVDLLTDGRTVWLSELTVYNMGGRLSATGNEAAGPETEAWDIRRSHFLRHPPAAGWQAFYARRLALALDRQDKAKGQHRKRAARRRPLPETESAHPS
ncbi:ATP-grasp fold amidoligase family protein [Roseitranquillus sediminis]|uniref:ATP-grasp fold amidoligase family protein n=1 Tax=Roseitranquillus sediminis TaxID=2809051 RepID=UPI001D0BFE9D|nr:ATP-grasp fold amidoligase family protein [Roseitranquillus sediminis]MBM9594657.1 hypothetical protein [Roseitranquillus sediminis]